MLHLKFAYILVAALNIGSVAASSAQTEETSSTNTLTSSTTSAEATTATVLNDAISLQSTAPANLETTAVEVADTNTSVSLPGGIFYQLLKQGSGPETSTTGTRLIHYTLFLTNGRKLESSRDAQFPVPFSFAPGADQAIKGMEVGTNGMRVGEIRKLFVPADQAYGDASHGNVPPGSPLVFTLELVALQ